MANSPIVAPVDQLPTVAPAATSSWTNGWKSILGALLIAGASVAEFYGYPAGPLRDLGLALLGIGLASKSSRILTALGSK